jgi:hypothetical protein
MKNVVAAVLLTALTLAGVVRAGGEIISTFKNNSIECDYLIVTTPELSGPAVALAQHRNSFKKDEVEYAKVVFLSQMLVEFPGFDYNHRNITLWRGLKWARENWKIPFKFLVLMGNDEFGLADSAIVSTGAIPTWYPRTNLAEYQWGVFPQVSDDPYISLSTVDPPLEGFAYPDPSDSNLSIGRIPAANAVQCSTYVEKVKMYDLSRPKGVWRNNVLAIADDAMQGASADMLATFHQASAESIVQNSFQGYSVTKGYLSAYPLDQFYEKPAAKSAIIQALNHGVSWAFFFGHGNDQVLTDERVLSAESIDEITNDSMPFVFVSFTSSNGSFLPYTPPKMCLKSLLSPKGRAIAYIASPCGTAATSNEALGRSLFTEVRKNPTGSLGMLMTKAKLKTPDLNSSAYFLLGDPALRVSTSALPLVVKSVPDTNPTHVRLSLRDVSSDVNYSITFTVRDSIRAAPAPLSVPDLSFSSDSTIGTVSGVFRDSVTVPLPTGLNVPVKAFVYVWNDTADGRSELIFSQGLTNPVVRVPLKAAVSTGPNMRKIRGGLFLSGLETGVNQVGIYDVMGRKVYGGEIRVHAGTATMELGGKLTGSGRYFLQVRAGASVKTLPFVYFAGGE